MKMGRTKALGKKPLVPRNAQNSGVATCQDASLLLGYSENGGMLSTGDSKKGLRRVLILKESLKRVPTAHLCMCLRCAIILDGYACCSFVKREELSLKGNRAKKCMKNINK